VTGLEDAFERIGRAAEDLLPRSHAPGLALAVTDREATLGVVVRGFADVAASRAVRPNTRFQIGSISKSFAALCVLQEESEGNLSLDVSVNELLPWVELPEPFGPITLHHLLTHTSGLMTGVEHGPWGIADAVCARAYPPTFAPGERFSYSNLGYKLVGHVLERVTGMPVHELLHERILGPLEMTRSAGAIFEDDRADAAVGYEPLRSDRPAHLQSPLTPAAWQVSNTADGSIVSTVGDLCAFARIVLARGAGLLDDDAFDRWIGPYADTAERGTVYGYGWDVVDGEGGRLIRHTGGTVGFNALLAISPEDGLAVAVCLNGYGIREALGSFALATVAAAVRGEPMPDLVPADPPDRVPNAGAIAGRFIAGDRTLDLDADDGGLLLRSGPVSVRLERWPDEPDTFAVPHPAFERHLLRLVRDEGGEATGLTHGPTRYGREGGEPPDGADVTAGPFGGLYRGDGPWTRAIRVYERGGRLFAMWPSDGREHELRALADGWFAVGDPALPRRCRFDDVVDGLTQTLEYDGARLSRSFDG
jgi:CubicO group peptidase (beta-lactamase class C family)